MNTFEQEVHLSQDVAYHAPMLVSQINVVLYFSYHMVHLICEKRLEIVNIPLIYNFIYYD